MKQRKPKSKPVVASSQNEKGHLFGKKNKVSVWASQVPYGEIPDSYFEEHFFKNNTRATNQWTDNYHIRYFRPDDLETNGVAEGLGDVKAVVGACSYSYSFLLPLMSKARKKKLTEVSWLILLYEYEYAVKISGIESDGVTTFLGAFDYRDDAEDVFEAEARMAAERLANPPEETAEGGFTFSKVTPKPAPHAETAPIKADRAASSRPVASDSRKKPSVAQQRSAKQDTVNPSTVKPSTVKPATVKPVTAKQDKDKGIKAVQADKPKAVAKVSAVVDAPVVDNRTDDAQGNETKASKKPTAAPVSAPRETSQPKAASVAVTKLDKDPTPAAAAKDTDSATDTEKSVTKKKTSFSFTKKSPSAE